MSYLTYHQIENKEVFNYFYLFIKTKVVSVRILIKSMTNTFFPPPPDFPTEFDETIDSINDNNDAEINSDSNIQDVVERQARSFVTECDAHEVRLDAVDDEIREKLSSNCGCAIQCFTKFDANEIKDHILTIKGGKRHVYHRKIEGKRN